MRYASGFAIGWRAAAKGCSVARRNDRSSLIVGLDIGTSKVVALVGEIGADGAIEVVGLGSHPSRGLKRAWW